MGASSDWKKWLNNFQDAKAAKEWDEFDARATLKVQKELKLLPRVAFRKKMDALRKEYDGIGWELLEDGGTYQPLIDLFMIDKDAKCVNPRTPSAQRGRQKRRGHSPSPTSSDEDRPLSQQFAATTSRPRRRPRPASPTGPDSESKGMDVPLGRAPPAAESERSLPPQAPSAHEEQPQVDGTVGEARGDAEVMGTYPVAEGSTGTEILDQDAHYHIGEQVEVEDDDEGTSELHDIVQLTRSRKRRGERLDTRPEEEGPSRGHCGASGEGDGAEVGTQWTGVRAAAGAPEGDGAEVGSEWTGVRPAAGGCSRSPLGGSGPEPRAAVQEDSQLAEHGGMRTGATPKQGKEPGGLDRGHAHTTRGRGGAETCSRSPGVGPAGPGALRSHPGPPGKEGAAAATAPQSSPWDLFPGVAAREGGPLLQQAVQVAGGSGTAAKTQVPKCNRPSLRQEAQDDRAVESQPLLAAWQSHQTPSPERARPGGSLVGAGMAADSPVPKEASGGGALVRVKAEPKEASMPAPIAPKRASSKKVQAAANQRQVPEKPPPQPQLARREEEKRAPECSRSLLHLAVKSEPKDADMATRGEGKSDQARGDETGVATCKRDGISATTASTGKNQSEADKSTAPGHHRECSTAGPAAREGGGDGAAVARSTARDRGGESAAARSTGCGPGICQSLGGAMGAGPPPLAGTNLPPPEAVLGGVPKAAKSPRPAAMGLDNSCRATPTKAAREPRFDSRGVLAECHAGGRGHAPGGTRTSPPEAGTPGSNGLHRTTPVDTSGPEKQPARVAGLDPQVRPLKVKEETALVPVGLHQATDTARSADRCTHVTERGRHEVGTAAAPAQPPLQGQGWGGPRHVARAGGAKRMSRWEHPRGDDISNGAEAVSVPWVNECGSESLAGTFIYMRQSAVWGSASISNPLSKVQGRDICASCRGDCLGTQPPCPCTTRTRAQYMYRRGAENRVDVVLSPSFLAEVIRTTSDRAEDLSAAQRRREVPYMPLDAAWGAPASSRPGGNRTPGGDRPAAEFIKECRLGCGCHVSCGNRVVGRGLTRRLKVFMTSGPRGWGLRTLEDMPAGAFVCEYAGQVLTRGELAHRRRARVAAGGPAAVRRMYAVHLDAGASWQPGVGAEGGSGGLCLDSTEWGNLARFINHSCDDWNLVGVPVEVETPDRSYYHLAFFTSRDVAAMEELTWDYGIDFGDPASAAFTCACGGDRCRDPAAARGAGH